MPSAASRSSARSAIAICPNAVGCTWSAISRLRAPKPRRSSTSAPCRRAEASIAAFDLCHLGAGARAAEVERHGRGQHAVAALGQEAERLVVAALEALALPVERAHVVDADVEAAEVVAARRRRPGPARASTSSTRAPSAACGLYGSPSPRASHSAHDCSATPHWSSPPPLVIESPRASTPRRQADTPRSTSGRGRSWRPSVPLPALLEIEMRTRCVPRLRRETFSVARFADVASVLRATRTQRPALLALDRDPHHREPGRRRPSRWRTRRSWPWPTATRPAGSGQPLLVAAASCGQRVGARRRRRRRRRRPAAVGVGVGVGAGAAPGSRGTPRPGVARQESRHVGDAVAVHVRVAGVAARRRRSLSRLVRVVSVERSCRYRRRGVPVVVEARSRRTSRAAVGRAGVGRVGPAVAVAVGQRSAAVERELRRPPRR